MAGGQQLDGVAEVHRFDVPRLSDYLRPRLDPFQGDLRVRQFQGGKSNPTFYLEGDGRAGVSRYVLRKKPPGTLLASAHQVEREYRVMRALQGAGVATPRMRHLCEDTTVVGTSFYVMDYVEGRIFRDARLPGLAPATRGEIYDELNRALVHLHGVDIEAAGLSGFGRPGNYFQRQIARWTRQYRASETETIPEMEELIEVLPSLAPEDTAISVAHGDYRLENVMFHPREAKLIAILDWELSTIGHPLADLAYNCFLWRSTSPTWGTLQGIDLRASGIPSEAEYVEAYLRRTGRGPIKHWNFYLSFAVFRLAAIAQGVHRRGGDDNYARARAAQALAILEDETAPRG
jgi:aminoglycoside phosphotransferase (APT) family kinase protein